MTFSELIKITEFNVNGYLIENSDYKIATESIIEIELIDPDSENKLANKAINVWTLTEKERIDGCQNRM